MPKIVCKVVNYMSTFFKKLLDGERFSTSYVLLHDILYILNLINFMPKYAHIFRNLRDFHGINCTIRFTKINIMEIVLFLMHGKLLSFHCF